MEASIPNSPTSERAVKVLVDNKTSWSLARETVLLHQGQWTIEPPHVIAAGERASFTCVSSASSPEGEGKTSGASGEVRFSVTSVQTVVQLRWENRDGEEDKFHGSIELGESFTLETVNSTDATQSFVTYVLTGGPQKAKAVVPVELGFDPLSNFVDPLSNFVDPLSDSLPAVDPSDHNEAPPTTDGTTITFNQEVYLKKLVIKHVLDKEVDGFSKKPTLEQLKTTVLLSFLYEQVFAEFPLFKKAGIRSKIDQILLQYPKLKILSKKATKDEEDDKYPIAMSVFDLAIRTPRERLIERGASKDDEVSQRRIVQELIQKIMQDIREKGVHEIFEQVKKAGSIEDLPETYKLLFENVHKMVHPKVFEELHDPKKLQKASNIYHLTPRRTLKTVISITNPIKMMASLLSLFLARPLGAKNLLQRMFEVMTDSSKTANQLKDAKNVAIKVSNKKFTTKIQAWVAEHYHPTPCVDIDESNSPSALSVTNPRELVVKILADQNLAPRIELNTVTNLTQDIIVKLYEYAALEMRKKDKQEFIELLGDEQLILVIKEVLPVLYQPLLEIYSHSDMPTLLEAFFVASKDIIALMQKEDPEKTKAAGLDKAMRIFEHAVFLFVRNIVAVDAGSISEILVWGTNFFSASSITEIDIQALLAKQLPEHRMQIVKEVNEWIAYRKEFREKQEAQQDTSKIKAPHQKCIPDVLVQPFLVEIEPMLKQVEKMVKGFSAMSEAK